MKLETDYAHTKEDTEEERWQLLSTHLQNVADLAECFAGAFDAGGLGRFAGLCHDIGKSQPEWQKYLRRRSHSQDSPGHRKAGSLLASQKGSSAAAFAIYGHHGGLPSRASLRLSLKETSLNQAKASAAEQWSKKIPDAENLPDFLKIGSEKQIRRACEFFVRMLFSCLVDADFLDTEEYMQPEKSVVRGVDYGLDALQERFQESQQRFDSVAPINNARSNIFESVVNVANQTPGFFSLSIPTGGGKTNTGMGFALRHAQVHGMRRIIVVIPYRSIIKQTANLYRDIFGDEAVIEHHSGVDPEKETAQNRLASENWDAPIIVTTSVQFFDSLHSHKPSRCRKLHNVAQSVVILDEVQTLSPGLLEPILDSMRELERSYRVSFVFSTATQPAFRDREGFTGLTGVRELAPDAHDIFRCFQRVSYEFPTTGHSISWEDLAGQLSKHEQVMTVVNTKKDAKHLHQALADAGALHLSSDMCPAHRGETLRCVVQRLEDDLPCRLVSTQVVEAGVDIDFPVVYRAFGPLDSIVQAAGRCNRECTLESGRLVVFRPAEGGLPPGAYQTATELTEILIPELQPGDMYSPELFQEYFTRLYGLRDLDKEGILDMREKFDFPETGSRFRLIDADTRPVLVPWGKGKAMIEEIQQKDCMDRLDYRRIQNYAVMLWSDQIEKAIRDALCEEIQPDLYAWRGTYDGETGIVLDV